MSALTDLFTNIANAIRTKTGSQATIVASDFPTEIANIPTGGVFKPTHIKFPGGTDGVASVAELQDMLDSSALDFTELKNTFQLFSHIKKAGSLDLRKYTFPKVKSINSMFYGSLFSSILFNSNAFKGDVLTSVQTVFAQMSSLTSIDLSCINFSKVTAINNMFESCSNLTSITFDNADFSSVVSVNGIFSYCSNLTHIYGTITNLGKAYDGATAHYSSYRLDLSSTALDHDSLVSIIAGLYDLNLSYNVAGGGTLYRQDLKLGSTLSAKLSAAEIQVATDKGWDVT